MAKSKNVDVSFEEFNNMISEFSEFGSLIDESEYANVPDWISTGNYTLNALISGDIFRGVPAGKITVFSGEESTGKTFLSLNVAKQAQLKDYMVFWIDTESALTKELTDRFEINPKRFRYEVFGVVSDVITFVKKTTNQFLQLKKEGKNPPKIIFILDSLGNLSTDKEITDSLEGNLKKDMTRAQEIKRMFRVLTTEIAKIQAPFVIINHVYEMVGSFIPLKTQAGGCLTKDEKVLMSTKKWKQINNIQIGDFVETIDGPHEVLSTFKFDNKKIIEMELENGQIIKATPEHKFLIEINDNERVWKELKDLKENDIILKFNNNQIEKIVIKRLQNIKNTEPVYDITVKDVSHYILKNGIISHNSGIKYNSSVTINLSKAKLKETSGKQIGVTVTCKLDKARFTIPAEPKKIQIHFLKGMNPFIGLETFITPEVARKIGFGPGKLSSVTGKYTHDTKEFPSYWVNFLTNKNVKKQMIYNTEYFTQERLEIINEEVKKQLTYGVNDSNVSELVEEDDDEIENTLNTEE